MGYNIKICSHSVLANKIVYVIQVTDDNLGHRNILRYRYSQLRNIHEQLVKIVQKMKLGILLPNFPGRKLFGVTNKSEEAVRERQQELNHYLSLLFSQEILFTIKFFQDSFLSGNQSQEVFQTISNFHKKGERNLKCDIERYILVQNVVIYYFRITNLNNADQWIFKTRYSDLRKIHEELERNKIKNLPEFPKRKFFGVTNRSPQDIQKRKQELQDYFNELFENEQVLNSQTLNFFVSDSKKQSQLQKQLDTLKRQNTKKIVLK